MKGRDLIPFGGGMVASGIAHISIAAAIGVMVLALGVYLALVRK